MTRHVNRPTTAIDLSIRELRSHFRPLVEDITLDPLNARSWDTDSNSTSSWPQPPERNGNWYASKSGWNLDLAFRVPGPGRFSFQVAGRALSLDRVCGDFIEIYWDHSKLLMTAVLFDASGHGNGAAMMISEIECCIKSLAQEGAPPDVILSVANSVLAGRDHGSFATGAIFQVDLVTGRIQFAGAGHSAYCITPAGIQQELRTESLPLGVLDSESFARTDCGIANPGQCLLLLSDGVYETFGAGGQTWGLDSVLNLVASGTHQPAHVTLAQLEAARELFRANAQPNDDVSSLLISCWE